MRPQQQLVAFTCVRGPRTTTPGTLVMQHDGNLLLIGQSGAFLWAPVRGDGSLGTAGGLVRL